MFGAARCSAARRVAGSFRRIDLTGERQGEGAKPGEQVGRALATAEPPPGRFEQRRFAVLRRLQEGTDGETNGLAG